jgi:hypothetical protein
MAPPKTAKRERFFLLSGRRGARAHAAHAQRRTAGAGGRRAGAPRGAPRRRIARRRNLRAETACLCCSWRRRRPPRAPACDWAHPLHARRRRAPLLVALMHHGAHPPPAPPGGGAASDENAIGAPLALRASCSVDAAAQTDPAAAPPPGSWVHMVRVLARRGAAARRRRARGGTPRGHCSYRRGHGSRAPAGVVRFIFLVSYAPRRAAPRRRAASWPPWLPTRRCRRAWRPRSEARPSRAKAGWLRRTRLRFTCAFPPRRQPPHRRPAAWSDAPLLLLSPAALTGLPAFLALQHATAEQQARRARAAAHTHTQKRDATKR